MRHRLRTPEGVATYKRRGATVEPAIGNLKKIISGLSRRGLQAATAEVNLAAAAFNLLKIYRMPAASRPKTLTSATQQAAGSVEPARPAPKVIPQHPLHARYSLKSVSTDWPPGGYVARLIRQPGERPDNCGQIRRLACQQPQHSRNGPAFPG